MLEGDREDPHRLKLNYVTRPSSQAVCRQPRGEEGVSINLTNHNGCLVRTDKMVFSFPLLACSINRMAGCWHWSTLLDCFYSVIA